MYLHCFRNFLVSTKPKRLPESGFYASLQRYIYVRIYGRNSPFIGIFHKNILSAMKRAKGLVIFNPKAPEKDSEGLCAVLDTFLSSFHFIHEDFIHYKFKTRRTIIGYL